MIDHSPLAVIERRVLDRTAEFELAGDDETVARTVADLVDAEIAAWRDAHRRGSIADDIHDADSVRDRALRNLLGFGPLDPLLADDDVWEVMWNEPSAIFVRRHAGLSGYHDEAFHDDAHVLRTLTKLLDRSSVSHRTLDAAAGIQDAQLDNGARLHIVHGDLTRGGHLVVNIRKFTGVARRSLGELVDQRTLSRSAAEFLRACARQRLSVVFSGAPGAGKTTLLTCTAAELDPALRVVVAEEVLETDIALPNVAHLQTRPERNDRPAVDLRRLVAGMLRMAPDIAIVGEVRDREALPLLLTLSSGVTGFTTVHAGSARQALHRLRFIAQLAPEASDIPMGALHTLVADVVDVVVHCERTSDGPRVREIITVEQPTGGEHSTVFTVTEVFRRRTADGELTWTGQLPIRARDRLGPLDHLTADGSWEAGR